MSELAADTSADETLSDVGEFGLIDRISRHMAQGAAVLLGPGDDAAVLAAPDGRVVASTDLLLEGRHFRTDWSTGYQIGRKAAAQNLADIAAMGAAPTGLLVGLAAPGGLPVDWARQFARGLADECALVGVSVAGGDTTRAASIMIAVTALGDLGGRAPVTRAGAHPGDMVAIAGELGWSACGYELLSRGAQGEGPRKAVARHRSPEPPYAQGLSAAMAGATAMIDVSDGLLADLGHIARESDVGIDLEPGAFPIPEELAEAARRLDKDVLRWILTGGEDHALAACYPAVADIPQGWSVVGTVLKRSADSSEPRVTVAGAAWDGPQGWDHFA
ncbi:MAG TPA: thiamine-phosphate kinase [Actinocrinis sp.]|uniref:thiamine-phosphate kinase n=1 Tax=Actinocrinis sp. TaxID=1920516 RepID=UPI002DDD6E81|nr:thiamine-phosphate kinase [Actinocrinis sp.]HEV2342611.1 thiamine-phosphate kinase [Actinocrinis sp.]